jgi:hypothetical protein
MADAATQHLVCVGILGSPWQSAMAGNQHLCSLQRRRQASAEQSKHARHMNASMLLQVAASQGGVAEPDT